MLAISVIMSLVVGATRMLEFDSKECAIEGQAVSKNNSSRGRDGAHDDPSRRARKAIARRRQTPARVESPNPDVAMTLKHFNQRIQNSVARAESKRLYLRVGDEVNHLRYEEWGIGVVMEIMTSSVPGGTCLARVRFQDGQLRCFNNDLDNEVCCYYFGVRRYWNPSHGVDAIRSKMFFGG